MLLPTSYLPQFEHLLSNIMPRKSPTKAKGMQSTPQDMSLSASNFASTEITKSYRDKFFEHIQVTFEHKFSMFDLPVFWPILPCYWMLLFVLTMSRQISDMIKYRYLPFNIGKQAKVPILTVFSCFWCCPQFRYFYQRNFV